MPIQQLHAHGYGFQLGHPFGNLFGFDAQVQQNCPAMNGIFNGCLIGERDGNTFGLASKTAFKVSMPEEYFGLLYKKIGNGILP